MRSRIVLLTPFNLGPYHRARYQLLQQDEIDLVVAKMPLREHYRPWKAGDVGVSFQVATPFEGTTSHRSVFEAAVNFLRNERPDVVVCIGYYGRFVFATGAASRWLRIPSALYLVGWDNEHTRNPVKELLKRVYVSSMFRAAVVTGVRSAEYASMLGVPRERIFRVGNVVDNNHFASTRGSGLPLPERFFLTVSRLSPEKNIPGLLRAFREYRQRGGQWHLCIAGTGPEEDRLKGLVPEFLQPQTHWLGWVDYDHLPGLYQASQCFILPSYVEPWGLVINEAMAAGRPVLVSTRCGSVPELCKEAINGYSFLPDATQDLTSLMLKIEAMPTHVKARMGEASREIVKDFSPEKWKARFVNAISEIRNSLNSTTAQVGRH